MRKAEVTIQEQKFLIGCLSVKQVEAYTQTVDPELGEDEKLIELKRRSKQLVVDGLNNARIHLDDNLRLIKPPNMLDIDTLDEAIDFATMNELRTAILELTNLKNEEKDDDAGTEKNAQSATTRA